MLVSAYNPNSYGQPTGPVEMPSQKIATQVAVLKNIPTHLDEALFQPNSTVSTEEINERLQRYVATVEKALNRSSLNDAEKFQVKKQLTQHIINQLEENLLAIKKDAIRNAIGPQGETTVESRHRRFQAEARVEPFYRECLKAVAEAIQNHLFTDNWVPVDGKISLPADIAAELIKQTMINEYVEKSDNTSDITQSSVSTSTQNSQQMTAWLDQIAHLKNSVSNPEQLERALETQAEIIASNPDDFDTFIAILTDLQENNAELLQNLISPKVLYKLYATALLHDKQREKLCEKSTQELLYTLFNERKKQDGKTMHTLHAQVFTDAYMHYLDVALYKNPEFNGIPDPIKTEIKTLEKNGTLHGMLGRAAAKRHLQAAAICYNDVAIEHRGKHNNVANIETTKNMVKQSLEIIFDSFPLDHAITRSVYFNTLKDDIFANASPEFLQFFLEQATEVANIPSQNSENLTTCEHLKNVETLRLLHLTFQTKVNTDLTRARESEINDFLNGGQIENQSAANYVFDTLRLLNQFSADSKIKPHIKTWIDKRKNWIEKVLSGTISGAELNSEFQSEIKNKLVPGDAPKKLRKAIIDSRLSAIHEAMNSFSEKNYDMAQFASFSGVGASLTKPDFQPLLTPKLKRSESDTTALRDLETKTTDFFEAIEKGAWQDIQNTSRMLSEAISKLPENIYSEKAVKKIITDIQNIQTEITRQINDQREAIASSALNDELPSKTQTLETLQSQMAATEVQIMGKLTPEFTLRFMIYLHGRTELAKLDIPQYERNQLFHKMEGEDLLTHILDSDLKTILSKSDTAETGYIVNPDYIQNGRLNKPIIENKLETAVNKIYSKLDANNNHKDQIKSAIRAGLIRTLEELAGVKNTKDEVHFDTHHYQRQYIQIARLDQKLNVKSDDQIAAAENQEKHVFAFDAGVTMLQESMNRHIAEFQPANSEWVGGSKGVCDRIRELGEDIPVNPSTANTWRLVRQQVRQLENQQSRWVADQEKKIEAAKAVLKWESDHPIPDSIPANSFLARPPQSYFTLDGYLRDLGGKLDPLIENDTQQVRTILQISEQMAPEFGVLSQLETAIRSLESIRSSADIPNELIPSDLLGELEGPLREFMGKNPEEPITLADGKVALESMTLLLRSSSTGLSQADEAKYKVAVRCIAPIISEQQRQLFLEPGLDSVSLIDQDTPAETLRKTIFANQTNRLTDIQTIRKNLDAAIQKYEQFEQKLTEVAIRSDAANARLGSGVRRIRESKSKRDESIWEAHGKVIDTFLNRTGENASLAGTSPAAEWEMTSYADSIKRVKQDESTQSQVERQRELREILGHDNGKIHSALHTILLDFYKLNGLDSQDKRVAAGIQNSRRLIEEAITAESQFSVSRYLTGESLNQNIRNILEGVLIQFGVDLEKSLYKNRLQQTVRLIITQAYQDKPNPTHEFQLGHKLETKIRRAERQIKNALILNMNQLMEGRFKPDFRLDDFNKINQQVHDYCNTMSGYFNEHASDEFKSALRTYQNEVMEQYEQFLNHFLSNEEQLEYRTEPRRIQSNRVPEVKNDDTLSQESEAGSIQRDERMELLTKPLQPPNVPQIPVLLFENESEDESRQEYSNQPESQPVSEQSVRKNTPIRWAIEAGLPNTLIDSEPDPEASHSGAHDIVRIETAWKDRLETYRVELQFKKSRAEEAYQAVSSLETEKEIWDAKVKVKINKEKELNKLGKEIVDSPTITTLIEESKKLEMELIETIPNANEKKRKKEELQKRVEKWGKQWAAISESENSLQKWINLRRFFIEAKLSIRNPESKLLKQWDEFDKLLRQSITANREEIVRYKAAMQSITKLKTTMANITDRGVLAFVQQKINALKGSNSSDGLKRELEELSDDLPLFSFKREVSAIQEDDLTSEDEDPSTQTWQDSEQRSLEGIHIEMREKHKDRAATQAVFDFEKGYDQFRTPFDREVVTNNEEIIRQHREIEKQLQYRSTVSQATPGESEADSSSDFSGEMRRDRYADRKTLSQSFKAAVSGHFSTRSTIEFQPEESDSTPSSPRSMIASKSSSKEIQIKRMQQVMTDRLDEIEARLKEVEVDLKKMLNYLENVESYDEGLRLEPTLLTPELNEKVKKIKKALLDKIKSKMEDIKSELLNTDSDSQDGDDQNDKVFYRLINQLREIRWIRNSSLVKNSSLASKYKEQELEKKLREVIEKRARNKDHSWNGGQYLSDCAAADIDPEISPIPPVSTDEQTSVSVDPQLQHLSESRLSGGLGSFLAENADLESSI